MEPSHDELVQNFCAITENWNVEEAVMCLERTNWDLAAASNAYMGRPAAEEGPRERPLLVEAPAQPAESYFTWVKGGISRAISSLASGIKNFFVSAPPPGFAGYIYSLNVEPAPRTTALQLDHACVFARDRNKAVLVYVHDPGTSDDFLLSVLCTKEVCSVLNDCFIFFAQLANSAEGVSTRDVVGAGSEMKFAVIDSSTGVVVTRLPSKEGLLDFLMRFVRGGDVSEEVRRINDRRIRQQQEKEFREAEREVIRKTEEEKKRREMKQKEEEEREFLRKQEEREKERRMDMIGEEPEVGDEVSQITFRLPSGEKIERRFEKNTQIQALYWFLEAKGVKNVEIVSGFPAKVLKNGSLESEGLVGRVLIHVRHVQET
jgi:hypothetical protein